MVDLDLAAIIQTVTGVGIVQAVLLYIKSRQEARKIGQEAARIGKDVDSATIANMERVMGVMRAELDRAAAKSDAGDTERAALARQVRTLAGKVARLETENAQLRAQVELLQVPA